MTVRRSRLVIVLVVVVLAIAGGVVWVTRHPRRAGPITVVVQDATCMRWSKDGCYLFYAKDDHIYRYSLKDGSRRAHAAPGIYDFDVSPDGNSIVRSNSAYRTYWLATTHLESGHTRRIHTTKQLWIHDCWWLPDGRILFWGLKPTPRGASATYLVSPDGGNLVRLGENKYPEIYSVDGDSFLYRRRGREYHIFDLKSGRERRLIFPGKVPDVWGGSSFLYLSKDKLVCYAHWRKLGRKSYKTTVEMLDLRTMAWTQLDPPLISQAAQISPVLTHYWVRNYTGRTGWVPPVSYYLVEIPQQARRKLASTTTRTRPTRNKSGASPEAAEPWTSR